MANLVTTRDYKNYKQMDHNKDDAKIDTLVSSVSQMVKTYCGHSIIDYYSATKTEIFDVEDKLTSEVFVTESPLTSVTSVQERSSIADSYETLTNNTHYYVDTEHDRIRRIDGSTGIDYWPQGFGAVKVVYNAGYSAVPADLKLAVYDLITYYLKDEHKERRVLGGASIQNASSSTQSNNVAFPDHIKRVLDLYKNF